MSEDGWIPHDGGPCPVKNGQYVVVRLREGSTEYHDYWEGSCFWQHDPEIPDFDIIAYRVLSQGDISNG